jgi:hypothetical protein
MPPIDFRNDRINAFFSPRHFAEPAVVFLADGTALRANVIPDLEYIDIDIGQTSVEATSHRVTAAARDLPGLAENDTIRLRHPVTDQQQTWRIRTIAPDSFGLLTLHLESTT